MNKKIALLLLLLLGLIFVSCTDDNKRLHAAEQLEPIPATLLIGAPTSVEEPACISAHYEEPLKTPSIETQIDLLFEFQRKAERM